MTRKERSRSKSARPAGTLVDAVLKKYGASRAVREHRIVTGWTEIVGPRVAARAWPDGLKDGILWVRVANSAWLHELSFLKDAVAERSNALIGGPKLVREVRFHLGARKRPDDDMDAVAELAQRLAERRRPTPKPRPEPSAAALARIEEDVEKVQDAELRDCIRALRRRLGI